jgi:hypothetical protein
VVANDRVEDIDGVSIAAFRQRAGRE